MRTVHVLMWVRKFAVGAVLLCLPACSDRDPVAAVPEGIPDRDDALQEVTCEASVADGYVRCAAARLLPTDLSAAIIGGQNTNVSLASSGVAYTEADSIFRFDVTLQNLLPERMGTADGVNLHEDGIRVFFSSGPTATSGSGALSIENADGRAVFTASDQPYFRYDEILETGEVSAARTWQIRVDPGVATFVFTVHVSAELQPLIVINEIMANPGGAVEDSAGEYVELLNAGRWPVNLNGFMVDDGNVSHTISADVIVPPGGYTLLGRSSDAASNGGISPDYLYASSSSAALTFPNSGPGLFRLRTAGGVTVDSVAYSDAAIAAPPGVARELIDPSLDNSSVDGGNWAPASVNYNASSRGTPGAENQPAFGVTAVRVATGLERPLYLTAPSGDDRLFVVEQPGRVRIIEDGELVAEPFLDLTDRVNSSANEQGLLSLVFHPAYATNGYFYVNFTASDGATEVVRFSVSSDPNQADENSDLTILRVPQPGDNHNGGLMKFGPDGMLYIGMGDGGGAGDPSGNGQNLATLHGAMLRIDVDGGTPYAIPADNPYVDSGSARPEIWASGLRNPWRFSFDHTDGLLYVADVGQGRREEVNVVPASQAGVNYGWNRMEGSLCYSPSSGCNTAGVTLPVYEYPTSDGCSITGGYVYRGDALPELRGTYFYADYCNGQVSSFRYSGGAAVEHRDWDLGSLGMITSFGEDADRELYIVSRGGDVYRLARP